MDLVFLFGQVCVQIQRLEGKHGPGEPHPRGGLEPRGQIQSAFCHAKRNDTYDSIRKGQWSPSSSGRECCCCARQCMGISEPSFGQSVTARSWSASAGPCCRAFKKNQWLSTPPQPQCPGAVWNGSAPCCPPRNPGDHGIKSRSNTVSASILLHADSFISCHRLTVVLLRVVRRRSSGVVRRRF